MKNKKKDLAGILPVNENSPHMLSDTAAHKWSHTLSHIVAHTLSHTKTIICFLSICEFVNL